MTFEAAPPPAEFTWNDDYLLGYGPMDATHMEFVEVVHALDTASDADLLAALDRVIVHAEAHFNQENGWMNQHEFPARGCHIDEHDKVLASAHEVRTLVAAGNVAVGRAFGEALKDWFPAHADYLDSALAKWMVKRSTGGSPVVLRRTGKAAASASSPESESPR